MKAAQPTRCCGHEDQPAEPVRHLRRQAPPLSGGARRATISTASRRSSPTCGASNALKGAGGYAHRLRLPPGNAGRPGCLGVSAVCEFGRTDPEVTALTDSRPYACLRRSGRSIADGKQGGSIGAEIDTADGVQFLGSTLSGMKVAPAAAPLPETLRGIARTAHHAACAENRTAPGCRFFMSNSRLNDPEIERKSVMSHPFPARSPSSPAVRAASALPSSAASRRTAPPSPSPTRPRQRQGRRRRAEIEQQGGSALAIKADSADPQAVQDAVAHTVEHFGGLDILVNNAGILHR